MQVTNLGEFKRDLNAFTKGIPDEVLKLSKKVALDLLTRIVQRNPVGNPSLWKVPKAPPGYVGGRSRANWQVHVGTLEPGDTPIDLADANSAAAVSKGVTAMAAAKPFDTIWIYNNVPYIIRLEYGHSKQAPNGMVRLALAEVEASLPK